MSVSVEYHDSPMSCCGLGMASGFLDTVPTGKMIKRWGFEEREFRNPTKEEVKLRFEEAKQCASDDSRNCCIISISSAQKVEGTTLVELAKEHGFSVMHEFYNPNSGNTVYLMQYTEFADEGEYKAYHADNSDDEDF